MRVAISAPWEEQVRKWPVFVPRCNGGHERVELLTLGASDKGKWPIVFGSRRVVSAASCFTFFATPVTRERA